MASSTSTRVEKVNEITIVKKKNTKSNVWLYFGLRATEGGLLLSRNSSSQFVASVGQSFMRRTETL